jgi:hypothetical protein
MEKRLICVIKGNSFLIQRARSGVQKWDRVEPSGTEWNRVEPRLRASAHGLTPQRTNKLMRNVPQRPDETAN